MTNGPSVGDATTGGPASTQAAQSLARGGYAPPNPNAELGGEPSFDIGGQQVTLSEMQRGYMRQSDYTRKTQDLATQRAQYDAASQLADALRQDPEGTIAALARETGVDLGRMQGGQQGFGDDPYEGDPSYGQQGLDPNNPMAAELTQLRQMVQELSQQVGNEGEMRANQWLDARMATVDQLANERGIEYDPDAVYEYAATNDIGDPLAAFLVMQQEGAIASPPAAPQGPQVPPGMERYLPQQEAAPQAPDPARQFAKQQVSLQAPRSGYNQSAVPPQAPEPQSFAEAAAQALRELNVTDWSQVSHEDSQPGVYVPGQ